MCHSLKAFLGQARGMDDSSYIGTNIIKYICIYIFRVLIHVCMLSIEIRGCVIYQNRITHNPLKQLITEHGPFMDVRCMYGRVCTLDTTVFTQPLRPLGQKSM